MPDLQGTYFYSDYNYFDSPLWSLSWDGKSASQGPVSISSTGGLISSFARETRKKSRLSSPRPQSVMCVLFRTAEEPT